MLHTQHGLFRFLASPCLGLHSSPDHSGAKTNYTHATIHPWRDAIVMTAGNELFGTCETLSRCWQKLLIADLLYKLSAFVLLTPLVSLLLRFMLFLSGQRVLSDLDIAFFLARPLGWVSAILVGGVWLALIGLEQASLLAIIAAAAKGEQLGAVQALRFALKNSPAILRVSWRIVGFGFLVLAPFVVVGVLTYFQLLNAHDINFYLDEWPREFQIAIGVGAVLLSLLVFIGIRLASNWILALPLVLFDRVAPRSALRSSSKLMKGNRLRVCAWIALWLLLGLVLETAVTFVAGLVGRWILPMQSTSLTLFAEKVGIIVLATFVFSVLINTAHTAAFTLLLFRAYRKWNPHAMDAIENAGLSRFKGALILPALTRLRITAALIIGTLFAALVGYLTLNSVRVEDHTKVMAHRGASMVAPENTIAAVQAAIDAGADWVEIDVQETVDGEVVVIHDSDLMKVARNPIKIWEATAEELRAIDIGSWFAPKFSDQVVPTLDEVLELSKGKIGVLIELKYYGRDEKLEERVAEIVDRRNMASQVKVMSLKPEGVRKMKALRPDWKCGVLLSVAIGNLGRMDADFFAVNSRFASRAFVQRVHRMNKEVYVWTVNDPTTMSLLINRGVDGIITDRPEITRQVLTQRAEMTLQERALTEIGALILSPPQSDEQ